MILFIVQMAVGFTATLSAAFWVRAALVRMPRDFNVGYGGTGGAAQELATALSQQGKWNAWAAGCAALSAFLQSVALGVSLHSILLS